jgi:hypothetical protein
MQDFGKCNRPPYGWYCTRVFLHSGPCAARERGWHYLYRKSVRFVCYLRGCDNMLQENYCERCGNRDELIYKASSWHRARMWGRDHGNSGIQ